MIELLILYILSKKELSMYGIHKFISDNFKCLTNPSFGAIKPALDRLEEMNYISSRKTMTDGGKLTGFYSLNNSSNEYINKLLLEDLSDNPLQFFPNAEIKIICSELLSSDDRKTLFTNLKTKALQFKNDAQIILEKNQENFYTKIVVDNVLLQYKNFILTIEALEQEI